ncbi:MAG: type II secretion system protein GspF [Coxiella sp. (in: Bacteria)]|nr:MAG: type II secretion system protein GspF [Coxiella sp. (in: g-proteobacteria)]
MTAYQYTAVDKAGKKQKGVAEADSPRQVRQQLREKSLVPISIDVVSGAHNKQKKRASFSALKRKSISTTNLMLLTHQMATLLSAGIPIDEMLTAVAEQTEKHQIKSIILGVRARVLEGYSLAASLDAFPNAFPLLYRTTIASGEKSGKLDLILLKLAEHTERQKKLRQKIQQALIYPALMTVVSVLIVVFMLIYVVPKIINTFSQVSIALPLSTRALIAISNFFVHYGWYCLGVFVVLGFIFNRSLKNKRFRSRYDDFVLKIPLFGKTMRTINEARFGRTFGILTAASVPVLEAMRAAAQLITPLPMKHAVDQAIERVREGSGIAHSLKETHYFAPMFVHLVASGENSGRLEMMLERATLSQEDNVNNFIESLLTIFEPVLILVMGAIVLFIVLAIMLPIFQMDQFSG